MFADNKFRFSLQWGNDTEEKARAGELLERMGNKKSEFVVLAVTEYLFLFWDSQDIFSNFCHKSAQFFHSASG